MEFDLKLEGSHGKNWKLCLSGREIATAKALRLELSWNAQGTARRLVWLERSD